MGSKRALSVQKQAKSNTIKKEKKLYVPRIKNIARIF